MAEISKRKRNTMGVVRASLRHAQGRSYDEDSEHQMRSQDSSERNFSHFTLLISETLFIIEPLREFTLEDIAL